MNELREYLPLLAPLILIQLVLIVVSLLDLRRRAATRGPKWMWVIIILFVNLIGPVIYLVVGRQED